METERLDSGRPGASRGDSFGVAVSREGIFTGAIKDWKQVGGKPRKILVLSRETSSDTHVFFREHLLKNANYSPEALLLPMTKAIQKEIPNNDNAIGYGGLAYCNGKRGREIVKVSMKKAGAAIFPSDDNVRSGKYPISQPLHVYTPGTAIGLPKAFFDFCLSSEGQALMQKIGYVRIR